MSASERADAADQPTAAETEKHGALMDAVYRRQRHIYDATRKFYLLGRDRLIESLNPGDGHVLEVGCGTGRNLIKAARRHPQARLYGFDISEEMLETARANVAKAGLSDRIVLVHGDAATFDARAAFGRPMDRAFLSYTLSMIPPWREAIANSLAQLTPDGEAHIVDFGQLERLPNAAKAGLDRWLATFHVEPRADLAQAMTEAADRVGRRAELVPLYRGYAWLGRIA